MCGRDTKRHLMAVNISGSLSRGGAYTVLEYSCTNIHWSSRDMSFWTAPINKVLEYWLSIHLGDNCWCLTVPVCLLDVNEPENNTVCLSFSNRKSPVCRDNFESTDYYQNNPAVKIKGTCNNVAFTQQDAKYSKIGVIKLLFPQYRHTFEQNKSIKLKKVFNLLS